MKKYAVSFPWNFLNPHPRNLKVFPPCPITPSGRGKSDLSWLFIVQGTALGGSVSGVYLRAVFKVGDFGSTPDLQLILSNRLQKYLNKIPVSVTT